MALGDITVTTDQHAYAVELLASATAVNGKPTGTAGISTEILRRWGQCPERIRVGVNSTAGSGTMTVTLTLWGRAASVWFVMKPLNASSAAPHTAVAIPETSADSISFSEFVVGVEGCDRLYLEIVAIAGTATAVTGYAIVGR